MDEFVVTPSIIEQTRTLLIAASDPDLLDQLGAIFDPNTYLLLIAPDSDTLLKMVNEGTPDLLLLDQQLGDVFRLCAHLKQRTSLQPIPMMILLDADLDSAIEQAFNAGAVDYLVKPLRPVIVRQRITALLHLHDMREIMREKEERYRMISNSISDYAYAYRVNPDGSLAKEWNTQAFETITGYSHTELDGDGWSRLIHPEDLPLTYQRYERLLRGEKDVTEFRIITKSGEIRWLRDYGQPIRDEALGRIVRIYGAAQDITNRKHDEETLREQKAELEERNQELDSFAHTVAHDLKNPIASMMGFTSLVLNYYDRMTDDKIKEYLSLIMESGYKLKEIINSLLLLAGVNKQNRVDCEPLDMRAIVNGAQKRMITMIDEQQAEILQPDSYPIAIGYAPWVEEVWANYLSNAIKYGGTPPLIQLGADRPRDGMVRFWIDDNGQGLTPEEQQKVFTPFTRLSQAKIEGHGLGLSVVHRIVERLGGKVGVETTSNGGCRFSFTLPQAPTKRDNSPDER
ncbi:MAG: ATP-binding protein [Anaerolineae bacterium]|nr:ATP-binding protein [Anaerolineae bacterium]